jgi:hypothetical protein
MIEADSISTSLPSERSFGFMWVIIFVLCAGYNFYHHNILGTQVFVAMGVCLILVTIIVPIVLRPLNKIWFKLGLFLGSIVSPVVMGILFFGLITPIAVLMRIKGRDVLKIKNNSSCSSYWVNRVTVEENLSSFKDQF